MTQSQFCAYFNPNTWPLPPLHFLFVCFEVYGDPEGGIVAQHRLTVWLHRHCSNISNAKYGYLNFFKWIHFNNERIGLLHSTSMKCFGQFNVKEVKFFCVHLAFYFSSFITIMNDCIITVSDKIFYWEFQTGSAINKSPFCKVPQLYRTVE